jgi:hypothetical protein
MKIENKKEKENRKKWRGGSPGLTLPRCRPPSPIAAHGQRHFAAQYQPYPFAWDNTEEELDVFSFFSASTGERHGDEESHVPAVVLDLHEHR